MRGERGQGGRVEGGEEGRDGERESAMQEGGGEGGGRSERGVRRRGRAGGV